MATKRKWVVRIVQTETPNGIDVNEGGHISEAFLESLRYAGLIERHEVDPHGLTTQCFDLHAPHGVDDKGWATTNAERMRTFGFNAVVAPSTR